MEMNKLINNNLQINIIEFNVKKTIYKYIDKYKFNYIYLNTLKLNKHRFNRSLAYNISINIFKRYIFSLKYILFHTYEYNINYNLDNILLLLDNNDIIHIYDENLRNNKLLQTIILNNEILDKVYNFDPEIFLEYNGYEIDFFLKKIDKVKINIKMYNLKININSNLILKNINMENYYFNLLNISDYFDICFLKYKYLINYNLWNNIKTYIINLDNRIDRYNYTWNECQKIGLYNIERFSAIKINHDNYNQYKLINETKAWKNDIKYL